MKRVCGMLLSPMVLAWVLMCGTSVALAAERTLVIGTDVSGEFAVGSTNFTLDTNKITALSSEGLNSDQLMRGIQHNGVGRFVDELLLNRDAAFRFQLQVPNDAKLYGASAGAQIPYTGFVLYPTTNSNTRSSYEFVASSSIPHMQDEDDAPIFASASEKYPLLIYSHGSGTYPFASQLEFLTHLASDGYIVLALFHGDNRFGDTEGRKFNLRPLTVKTAIDVLLADPAFSPHIDTTRIGGLGESFGGATMMALLGAKKINPDAASVISNDLIETTVDQRIVAAATLIPYMGKGLYTFFGTGGSGAASIDRPFMANSGNADDIADYSLVQAAMNKIPGVKYLVEYNGELHAMGPGATMDSYAWSKVFLDAFVKKDAEAVVTLSQLKSVSGDGQDSLVLVTEPDPSSDTGTVPIFENNQLTVTGVAVGEATYDVTLQLVGEDPITFSLINAVDSSPSVISTGSFAANVLTIPSVNVNGGLFSVTMTLSNENPIQFTLSSATEK